MDDNVEIYELLKRIMEVYKIESDYAENGEQALKFLKYEEYDFVFLDLIMPRMYGIEVLRRLNNMRKQKMPEIVIMSGYTADELMKETMELGVKLHLNKPFEVDEVINILKSAYEFKTAV